MQIPRTKQIHNSKLNKIFFPKSIFVAYVIHGVDSLAGHINLNSKSVELQKTKGLKDKKFRVATTFTTQATTEDPLSFTYQIPAFDDIQTQCIESWKNQLSNIAQLCKWTAAQELHVIQRTISPELLKEIYNFETPTEAYKKLLQLAHPDTNLNSLYDHPKTTSQTDYRTIAEYFEEIQDINKKIGNTLGLTEEQIVSRVKETFYTNLHHITKVEMQRQGLKEISEIFKRIQSVETIILQQTRELYEGKNKSNTTPKQTYCDYHMTKYHSNQECKAQRREKQNEERNNRKEIQKNNFIKEPEIKVDLPKINLAINEKETTAIIDTGASRNYISNQLAKILKLPITKLNKSIQVELGDGSYVEKTKKKQKKKKKKTLWLLGRNTKHILDKVSSTY